jgi:hypothetical protein
VIFSTPTKHGAGIALQGDYHDFQDLHESIHQITKTDVLSGGLGDFVLGLAYEVRHAYQGDRDVQRLPANIFETETTTYFSFRTLWPIFLYQIGLLRWSAAFQPTSRDFQATIFRLEASAENALTSYDPFVGSLCVEWLVRFQPPPKRYLLEYIPNCSLQYVTLGKPGKSRFKNLPEILRMLSGYSEEYRAYQDYMQSIAKEKGCEPEALMDLGEWPDFKW